MKTVDVRDALSAVIDHAGRGKPSIITRHGRPEAALLSFEYWQRLSNVLSFGQLLMEAPLDAVELSDRQDEELRDPAL